MDFIEGFEEFEEKSRSMASVGIGIYGINLTLFSILLVTSCIRSPNTTTTKVSLLQILSSILIICASSMWIEATDGEYRSLIILGLNRRTEL
jgi:hypothetical protein